MPDFADLSAQRGRRPAKDLHLAATQHTPGVRIGMTGSGWILLSPAEARTLAFELLELAGADDLEADDPEHQE